MSITTKIKELNEARTTVAQLEQVIAAELNSELAALPAQYGFASVADFVAAFEKAAGKRRGRKPGRAKAALAAAGKPEASAKAKRRKKRAVITDATRDEVKKLIGAGKSGSEIAKAVGISVPSVQNIKKALGLVGKPGKAKAEVAPATEAKPKAAAKPVAPEKPKAPAKKKRRKRPVKTDATKAGVKAG
jgi:DNA invertase Pin-like site-specific DNA recombinase